MSDLVLITGGAGFIGSHLADELLRRGYRVRALDNLSPQVHGPERRRPDYLDPDVELVVGDVRDPDAVRRALDGVDAVYHFAAAVGVGQSMYEVAKYTGVNDLGTAVLLEALIARPVRRLVVASSMSLYGEGLYRAPDGSVAVGLERTDAQLRAGDWEVRDARGDILTPLSTPETKAPAIASIYALGKYDQERMCLMIGRAYGIETAALRFFNAFGTRQALSNPYTGVLAIFASRLLNGNRPSVFEDGRQRRDFVSVYDVARACRLALESPAAAGDVFNVGSGRSYAVVEVARMIAAAVGREDLEPEITAQYRVGDIRHCFADITKARHVLGYEPTVTLERGLGELAGWLEGQAAVDRVAEATAQLAARGLTVSADTAVVRRESSVVGGRTPARHRQRTTHGSRPRTGVLITGGAGFIGSNLAHRLLSQGERVVVLDNLSRPGVERNLQWLQATHGDRVEAVVADVRDAAAVRDAVARATQVYHFAAQVAVTSSLDDPRHDFEVNLGGTLNVLEALRQLPAPPPLLYTSTNKVYGALDDVTLVRSGARYAPERAAAREHGLGEDRSADFHSPYGCSKGAADQYVRDYARSFGLRTAVFRMSCIYGPRQFGTEDQGWIAHFLIRALRGQPITLYGDGHQVRDALFVDDLVDAMLLARQHADRLAGSIFNMGGGQANATSLLEVLDAVAALTGRAPVVRFGDWRVGDQRYYVTDTRRFRAATGWAPRVSLAEGIRRLHRWLVESGSDAVPALADVAVDSRPSTLGADFDFDPDEILAPVELVAEGDTRSETTL